MTVVANTVLRVHVWWVRVFAVMLACLFGMVACAAAQIIFDGDGSGDPGFVDPRENRGTPPPPPPAHISSGESFLGGAAPVTPLARSEKKMPPSPPVLFTKLTSPYGTLDWASRPNDLGSLLKSMKGMTDVDFQLEVKSLSEISLDPDNNPVLYRSGHFRFSLE